MTDREKFAKYAESLTTSSTDGLTQEEVALFRRVVENAFDMALLIWRANQGDVLEKCRKCPNHFRCARETVCMDVTLFARDLERIMGRGEK